jgi:site-specific DNA-methyltransferase (adenine-specific)
MATSKKRTGTRTSSFGSPGRANHDSSAFYRSRLYQGLPQETQGDCEEHPVPAGALDRVLCKSAEKMDDLPDASVHLMVTSPPWSTVFPATST